MNNEKLLALAADLIQGVDETKTDTVEIQTGQYDDGSTMLTISIAFLIPEDETNKEKEKGSEGSGN